MKAILSFFALLTSLVAFASTHLPGGCPAGGCPNPPIGVPGPIATPVHVPPRSCATRTTCSACNMKADGSGAQMICTVVDCRGEIQSYFTQICELPKDPTNPGQNVPTPKPRNPGQQGG